MAQGKKLDNGKVLNQWELHLEPWSAELDRCDENWEHIPDSPDYVNLLEEKDHTPGTVKGYYYDDEYPFLMERVLEIVREMKPELKDQLI